MNRQLSPRLSDKDITPSLYYCDTTDNETRVPSPDHNGPQLLLTRNLPGWLLDGLLRLGNGSAGAFFHSSGATVNFGKQIGNASVEG
jgi:hypothetical protein